MKNPLKHGDDETRDHPHSKESDESGTKDGSTSEPDVPAPFAPDSDEDSALGDTDEHSDA